MDPLTQFLLGKIYSSFFKKAYSILQEFLKNNNSYLTGKIEDIQQALKNQMEIVQNWSHQINFTGLLKSKDINSTYVELDLELSPRRVKYYDEERVNTTFDCIFNNEVSNIVILGQLGAGKTTSMKRICQDLLLNENSVYSNFEFPLVIRLRELNKKKNPDIPIFMTLCSQLNINIRLNNDIEKDLHYSLITNSVMNFLNELKVLLILDGFDEITDEDLLNSIMEDLRILSNGLTTSKFVLTSRTADYNISLDNTNVYELKSLSDEKIIQFAANWLQSDDLVNDFILQLKGSPFYDTAIRPLTLAHLLAIFERNGKIPDKPKSVYKRIINLLIEEWNSQKSVVKKSKYAKFEVDRKFEFLSKLSYMLTVEFAKSTFTKEDLVYVYNDICELFSLPKDQVDFVVNEIESHNGLFLKSAYDRYEFAHKSIQEYLTADYIVRDVKIPTERNLIRALPNEIALAISLSSNPVIFFKTIINSLNYDDLSDKYFIRPFLVRLSLEEPDFPVDSSLTFMFVYLYTIIYFRFINVDREFYKEMELIFIRIFKSHSINQALPLVLKDFTKVEGGINEPGVISYIKKYKAEKDEDITEYVISDKFFV